MWDYNQWQRSNRKKIGNINTKRYEKTKKGFLVRLYRNMKSRIEGVQKRKHHLYEGKDLIEKEEFYTWALSSENFHILFDNYEKSEYDRQIAPSVDRIDSSIGYVLGNMEWVTCSENSRRGALSQARKRKINESKIR